MTPTARSLKLLRSTGPVAGVVAALPSDWRERYEERAAIRQYDGGLPRDVAEAAALAEVLAEMRETAAEKSR